MGRGVLSQPDAAQLPGGGCLDDATTGDHSHASQEHAATGILCHCDRAQGEIPIENGRC